MLSVLENNEKTNSLYYSEVSTGKFDSYTDSSGGHYVTKQGVREIFLFNHDYGLNLFIRTLINNFLGCQFFRPYFHPEIQDGRQDGRQKFKNEEIVIFYYFYIIFNCNTSKLYNLRSRNPFLVLFGFI